MITFECEHCYKKTEVLVNVLVEATADATGKTIYTKIMKVCPRCAHEFADLIGIKRG